MRSEILLIGPMCSGKTTIAKRLARRLKMPHLDFDYEKQEYFNELNYDEQEADERYMIDGIKGLYNFNKFYEYQTFFNILQNNSNCIFDVGAGFVIYENDEYQNSVLELLSTFQNIFLILPYPCIYKSSHSLTLRMKKRFKEDDELEMILKSSPGFNLDKYLLEKFYINFSHFNKIYTSYSSIKTITNRISKIFINNLLGQLNDKQVF